MKYFSLILVFLFILGSCKKKIEVDQGFNVVQKNSPSLVPITVAGIAKKNSETISIGNHLSIGDKIRVGAKSFVDLQVLHNDIQMTIRLESGAVVELKKDDTDLKKLIFFIDLGNAYFNIKKSNNYKVEVQTPLALIQSKNAFFSVEVALDGSSKNRLIEGKMTIRPLIPKIDKNLDNPNFLTIRNDLEKISLSLQDGEEVDINQTHFEKFAENLPEDFLTLIEKSKDNFVGISTSLSLNEMNQKSGISIKKIDSKTMKNIETHAEELLPIDNIKEGLVSSITLRIDKERNRLNHRMELYFDEKLSTIQLINGEIITGILLDLDPDSERLELITLEGNKSIQKSEILPLEDQ
jgi:hypothetical protein